MSRVNFHIWCVFIDLNTMTTFTILYFTIINQRGIKLQQNEYGQLTNWLLNIIFTKLELFCDPHLHIHLYSCPDEVHNLSSHYRLRRMSISQSFCLPASPPCQCAVHSSFLKSAGRCFPVLKKERKDLLFFNNASSATSLLHIS